MRNNDSLQPASRETRPGLNAQVPGRVNRLTLKDPQQRKDNIRHYEKHKRALKRSLKNLRSRKPHQENTNRDFSPHQSSESLDPFAIGIFAELEQLVLPKIELMAPEAVVKFYVVEA